MSEHVWARVGQVGALLAGLAAVVTLIISLSSPSNLLVAEIYPMGFGLPFSADQIEEAIKTGNLRDHLRDLTDAKGLVMIKLHNVGELTVTNIQVKVTDAVLYATGEPGANRSLSVLPDHATISSDQTGVKLDEMRQGDHLIIFVWTKTPLELYQYWRNLSDQFQITFPQGIATKHIYIENNLFEGWFERNWIYLVLIIWFGLAMFSLFMAVRERLQINRARRLKDDPAPTA
jgi:hypothetical protein